MEVAHITLTFLSNSATIFLCMELGILISFQLKLFGNFKSQKKRKLLTEHVVKEGIHHGRCLCKKNISLAQAHAPSILIIRKKYRSPFVEL